MAVSSCHVVNDRWRRMHDAGDRLAGSHWTAAGWMDNRQ